jgi:hypothetical protein
MKAFSVFLWFCLAATSFLGAMLPLLAVMLVPRPAAGPGAPLAGEANLIALVVLVVSAVIFALSVRFRPRSLVTPRTLLVSAAIYLSLLIASFTTARSVGSETLELTVLDPQQKPVSGATITYDHSPRGGGLSGLRSAESGTLQTDSSGRATISTHRGHETRGQITHPQFVEVNFGIDRDWGGGQHQTGVGWLDPRLTHKKGDGVRAGDMRGFHCNLPAAPRLSLVVYLPQPGTDQPLPYPTQ